MNKFKVGDAVQLVHNCVVTEVGVDSVKVHDNEKGLDFYINGGKLLDTLGRADSSPGITQVKLTKTEIVEKLLSTHGRIFTVKFEKQSGETRTLRGYLAKAEPLLGRSYCVDVDVKEEHRLRLVDHRTISDLTFEGTHYYV